MRFEIAGEISHVETMRRSLNSASKLWLKPRTDAVVAASALVEAIRNSLGQKGESTGKTVPAVLSLAQGLSGALQSG
jgi:hypothetical protein